MDRGFPMRVWWAGFAVLVLVLGLGCGGIWRDVVAETFSQMTVLLDETVPPGSPRRDQVQHRIDQGFVAAWERHIGLLDLVPFESALEEVVLDGVIDEAELALLEEHAAPFDDHPVDPDRWAELMLLKRAIDDRIRREVGTGPAVPAATGPADWVLPDDLQRRLSDAGFTVARCVDEPLETHRRVTCRGQGDRRSAVVTVERYEHAQDAVAAPERDEESRVDRGTVLTAAVVDGAASESLRDELYGSSGRAGLESTRRGLEALGWTEVRCATTPSGVATCSANLQGRAALVRLEEPVPDLSAGRRVQDGGVALIRQGAGRISVRVGDHDGAVALADDLTSGGPRARSAPEGP